MKTIFISSTFQDMQHERDIIQAKVLPRIREFIKQYGETIELCDLRWGIDSTNMSESESTGKILQVCFDEIDNSRPFFIGLLGDRYGWIPNSDLVRDILAAQGKVIPESTGKSVTEMEILYGAFLSGNDENQSVFYFRTIEKRKRFFERSTLPEIYLSQNREDKKKIRALKNKIEAKMPGSIRPYTLQWDNSRQEFNGLDDFAEKVFEDLKAMIESRLGKVPVLSEYELSRRQQMYAVETDAYFSGSEDIRMTIPAGQADALLKGIWAQDFQNLFLSANDSYSLNRLAASLCRVYKSAFDFVIPFDCTQSPMSGTTDGLLSYLLSACREILNDGDADNIFSGKPESESQDSLDDEDDYESADKLLWDKRKLIHECFKAIDGLGHSVLIVIRNMDRLKEKDSLWWLPLQSYRNIRFIISSCVVPVGSERFKKITKIVFIPSGGIFEPSQWVNVYLRKYHKQIDEKSKKTLLELSDGKHEQYLEFLIQRLLVLDEKDFSVIRENGGGIDAISSYFCGLLRKQPDNLEDMICRMSKHLQEVIGPHFVRSVTGMLLAAPYGLSEQLIREIDSVESIGYSRLNMRTFCRAYTPLIIETLDGYIRFNDTPAVRTLRENFRLEMRRGAERLERHMRNWLEGAAEHEAVLRNQYLQIAFHADANKALAGYIRAFQKDPEQIAAIIHELMNNDGAAWLQNEMSYLSLEEYYILAHYVYPIFKSNGWTDDTAMNLWESCKESAEKNLSGSESHKTLEMIFYLSYQCGEIAFRLKSPKAEDYFLSAKEISRRDFQTYHNRMWRMERGLPLTEEEKEQDKKFFSSKASAENLNLLYGTDLSDMLSEQSWSDIIRSINNYLAIIYKEQGNQQKAAELQKESENLTHLMDPNIQNAGRVEIAPGITMITPEEIRGEKGKKSYQPDYRRNTAIQIAKQAQALREDGEYQAALEKYKESSEILLEIYQDGEDKKYYRFDGVSELEIEQIRTECLRDLLINFRSMAQSAYNLKMPRGQVIEFTEKMLKYALVFDEARNSEESKLDLEDSYYFAAGICSSFAGTPDHIRCLSYCEKYFHCREEAFAKGGKWDKRITEVWRYVAHLFYQYVTGQPNQGSRATDILLEVSNKSVMYNDFEGFCRYTHLVSDLLDWTRQNGVNWTSGSASLEGLYIHSICNICQMWMQHKVWNRFEQDALELEKHTDHLLEEDSKLQASDTLSQLGLHYFKQGNYDKAADVFGHVMKCLTLDGSIICPPIIWIQHQSRYISALSEVENLEEASRESEKEEAAIHNAMSEGYSEQDKAWRISRKDFEYTLKNELATLYLNRAIIQSRMGKNEQAQKTLAKAESCIKSNPELKAETDLVERVRLYREQGLPKRKDLRDGEKEYRAKLDEISQLIDHCMKNSNNITRSQLADLERKMSQLENIPEHSIFMSCHWMAKAYHTIFQLYFSLKDMPGSFRTLELALQYVQKDSEIYSLYGDIISDMTLFIDDDESKIEFIGHAIDIYTKLRKSGKNYSKNSLAMALRNRGLFLFRRKRYEEAKNDVENAVLLWKELLREKDSKEIKDFLADADRLLGAIREKIAIDLT